MPPLDPFATQSIILDSKSNVEDFLEHDQHKLNAIPTKETVPSILEIKKNIPKKFFAPSLLQSFKYVAWDLCVITLIFAAYHWLDSLAFIPSPLKNLVLFVYAFFQGTMFWAIFVLGHDCGHGSFSRYPWVNDTVGTFLHSLILVPYTTWKLSHRHHHKNTGNIDKDEVFYPLRESEALKMTGNESKGTNLAPYFAFGIGWLIYLIEGYGTRATSHVNPFHPLFKNNRAGAFTSIICVIIGLCFLYYASTIYGAWNILRYYFLPWIIFSSWLVITTFLHHHGVEENLNLPWFSDDKWSYVLGNLSSVDRDYGFLHDVTHSIGTHQIHHLFPAIPHYYLKEATVAFRAHYPKYVQESNEPILRTFLNTFNVFKSQYIISDNTKVFLYNDSKKLSRSTKLE
ncbi:6524_t:CDS:1 [Ambispora leptoticha]|uniref:6524_t:CDS:1 n=1 Tax=Ambispora leptoticha TaxID=144679 RepID=A0A9N8WG10_9GLOM|nr:6524_t:CDS:1 [Ambispora leptoticha]